MRRGRVEDLLRLNGRVGVGDEVGVSSPVAASVKNVAVTAGQRVDAGQVLVELDLSGIQSDLQAARDRLTTAQAKVDKARAPIQARLRRAEDEYTAPTGGPRRSEQLASESNIVAARGALQRAEADLAKLLSPPRSGELQAAEQEAAAARAALDRAQADRDRLKGGPDPSAVRKAQADLASAQNGLDKAKADLQRLQAGPDPLELRAAERQVQQAQADVRAAQDNGPIEAAQAELRAAQSTKTDKDTTQAQRDAAIARAQFALRSAQSSQAAAQERARAAIEVSNDRLAKLRQGPKPSDLEIARRNVQIAQAAVDDANDRLKTVQGGPNDAIDKADAALAAARSALQRAEARVQDLRSPASSDQVAAARTAVESARLALASAAARASEGNGPQAAQSGQARDAQAKIDAQRALLDGPLPDDVGADPNDREAADLIRARKDAAAEQATVDKLQQSLGTNDLTAPGAGIVSAVQVKVGDALQPGVTAVMLAQDGEPIARADLNDRDAARLSVGQAVSVLLQGGPEDRLSGTVAAIANDGNGRTALLRVAWPSAPSLGTPLQATITLQARDGALLVPSRAVRAIGERRYVDVLDGTAQRRTEIQVGIVSTDDTEVVSGLREGQLVLVGL